MLRVFLRPKWQRSISHYTKVRGASKSSMLVTVLWKKYFFLIWHQRNTLLHKEKSFFTRREHEVLNKTLRMIKDRHKELIHFTRYHLVDYTDDHINGWSINTKQEMVNLLVVARLSYAALLKKGDWRQSLIINYWKWCITSTSGVHTLPGVQC